MHQKVFAVVVTDTSGCQKSPDRLVTDDSKLAVLMLAAVATNEQRAMVMCSSNKQVLIDNSFHS